MSRTKVYYNSACPVCDAGIGYQRRKLGKGADDVDWIDVHLSNEAASEVASSVDVVRERLHVVDEEGAVHVGADAFAELWGRTDGQRKLARFVRLGGVRTLARWLYNAFAKVLYHWNRWRRHW